MTQNRMDKNTVIQELRSWNDAILEAQARPFLYPLGLDIRFDAESFDEDELRSSDCIVLYKGASVFEKLICYWINFDAMADYFIKEDDSSQNAYKEQIHINLFYVIGAALVEMFMDLYGTGDQTFDTLIQNLPDTALRSLLQGDGNSEQETNLYEEFAASHQDNSECENPLYQLYMQFIKYCYSD